MKRARQRSFPCAALAAPLMGALVGALACASPASPKSVEPLAWDSLCPAQPGAASDALSIVARGDAADLELEPSGAAVIGGRVAVIGDKQASLWWWTPVAPSPTAPLELTQDRAWDTAPVPLKGARSCCVDPANASWGSPIKREKAGETCDAHHVARGASTPWLKGEALASTLDGALVVGGNMGFDCVENELRALDPARHEARPLAGLERARVLEAIGASDVRVEGLAFTRDGTRDLALVGVRQLTKDPDPDSRDVTMTRTVVSFERAAGAASFSLLGVVVLESTDPTLGLSDLLVLEDGRVLASVSIERTVDGVHEVGGALLATESAHPWRDRTQQSWRTREIARFSDHKPEGMVSLSPTCTLVVFDDDEKVKKQQRKRGGGPAWASHAAFARFVRVPSGAPR